MGERSLNANVLFLVNVPYPCIRSGTGICKENDNAFPNLILDSDNLFSFLVFATLFFHTPVGGQCFFGCRLESDLSMLHLYHTQIAPEHAHIATSCNTRAGRRFLSMFYLTNECAPTVMRL